MNRRAGRVDAAARLTTCALATAGAMWLGACSERDRVEIHESRPRHSNAREPLLNVPYEQAFPEPGEYRWNLPPGWKEEAASNFRLANFSFGPNREGECYLSVVQGGLVENIGRWCQQMGREPMTEEEVAQLPEMTLFGRPGRVIDLSGTYTGATGAGPKSDYRLHGVVVSASGETVTVKMTGPAAIVADQIDAFDTFCESLRLAPGYPKSR